jgi:t-SNARE complex subunit (syntaxin)
MFFKKKKTKLFDVLKGLFEGMNKISDIAGKAQTKVRESMMHIEIAVKKKLKRLKKIIFFSVLELTFVMIGIALLVLAGVLFFARFYPIDAVLLIGGLVCLYIAWMFFLAAK